MSNKKTTFNENWISNPKFKSWVNADDNNTNAFVCVICHKSVSLSNMGVQALTSHMNSKKHQTIIQHCTTSQNIAQSIHFQKPSQTPVVKLNTVPDVQNKNIVEIQSSSNASSNKQIYLTSMVERDSKTKSEILWALHLISSHISLSAGAKSIDVMKLMFPDSEIVKNVQLQRTKLSYLITYGLARHFKLEFDDELSNCSYYTVEFDESLNKVSQKEQLDVHIRYWNDIKKEVCVRYFTSVFLGHTNAVELLKALKEAIKFLNFRNIIQISMDGPNVNIKMLHDFKEELQQKNENSIDHIIFDIGSCGLHTMHNAFKNSIKSSKWNIIEFFRAIYNVFKDVPDRRADFIKFTDSTTFPKKFCAVRWLQNIETSERAIKILPNLKKYVECVQGTNRKPSSYSYNIMVNCLKDNFLHAKIAFFQTLASDIEPFLKIYQTDSPLVPFLYTDLSNILKLVMERFVKAEVLDKCNNNLTKIDVLNKENLIGPKKINLGYSTRAAIRLTNASEKDILQFRIECHNVLQIFCQKLLDKYVFN